MTTYRMRLTYILPFLGLLLPGVLAAQSAPSSSTTTSGSNRRQELYDQYHGVTKKPASAPMTPSATATRPARVDPAPAPVATTRPLMQPPVDGSTSGFRIGARFGANYPIDLETQVGDPVAGLVGGLVMQFGKGLVSFQPEINYSRTGYKANVFPFGEITAAADQLVVPLFVKFSTGTMDGTRFFLNVGPYGSYLTSVSIDGVKQPLANTDTRFSFGAAAGIGAMIKAGPGHVTVEARGSYLLGDASRIQQIGVAKSILTEGAIGYVFPLGGR